MKKLLIKIFVVAATFIVMNSSLYSLPYEQLGDFKRSEKTMPFHGTWISFLYFEFGMVTRGFGDDVIYLYGQEDLPCCYGKGNIEKFANINEDIHVYVYEANDIANPIPTKHKILKGDVGYKLQNLILNIEKGRLYILLFSDEKGAVLDVQKIILDQ